MMNITFYSDVSTKEKALSIVEQLSEYNLRFYKINQKQQLIEQASDTDVLLVDAMGVVDKKMIDALPNLKLIQSEGVGYQGFDVEYATQKGIAVCNNKCVNDTAVGEVAIMLMLSCLRDVQNGREAVYSGKQIEKKKAVFGKSKELSQCTVGLIGFGDIAKATAKYLNAFGAKVMYYNRTRYENLESEYNVEYSALDDLLNVCDIVSLHTAVTQDTKNMVNKDFLGKMKSSAYLINTSRGELVDNDALLDALLSGTICGAGLDVISPEPVLADNILLDERIKSKLIVTPHIAGITSLTIQRVFKNIYNNILAVQNNTPLSNRVN